VQELVNDKDYELIRNYITDVSGIVIPPEKKYLIETKLSNMMLSHGALSFDDFYRNVLAKRNPETDQKVINAITVNETLWFRDAVLWKCFEREILPGFIEQLRAGKKKKIRIWSTAASTGQEPYSIAMCIDNYIKRNKILDISLLDFEIFATDISDRVLEIAKTGRYDKISMTRGISEHYKAEYFNNVNSAWDIQRGIKESVKFECFNLKNDFSKFGKFDIIFCRYVLIYFQDSLKNEIITKIHDSLSEGGILFTGIYVLYNILRDVFNAESYENLTYYTKAVQTGQKERNGDL